MNIYYLYVKTHRKTGLKYLGQTKNEPSSYHGSGKYWQLHIEKHGYDVDTKILQKCYSKSALKAWGLFYSNLWSVVISNKWANLKPESGDGGGGPMTQEALAKQAATFASKTPEEREIINLKRKASLELYHSNMSMKDKKSRATKIKKGHLNRSQEEMEATRSKRSTSAKAAAAKMTNEEKSKIGVKIGNSLRGIPKPASTLAKRAATIASMTDEQRNKTYGASKKGKPWTQARRKAHLKKKENHSTIA